MQTGSKGWKRRAEQANTPPLQTHRCFKRPNKSSLLTTFQLKHPWSSNMENRPSLCCEHGKIILIQTCVYRYTDIHKSPTCSELNFSTLLVKACKEAKCKQATIDNQNGRDWVKEKENERKKEWKCVDLPSCSSLLRLKPPVWASAGVSGLLSDSTHIVSCDTNSPHPSPTPENSVKRDGQRKKRERKRERKQEAYLPDKAHTHKA